MDTRTLGTKSDVVFRSFFIKLLMSSCGESSIVILKDQEYEYGKSSGLPSYYANAIGYQKGTGELHEVRIAKYNNYLGVNMSGAIRSKGKDKIARNRVDKENKNKTIIKIVNVKKEGGRGIDKQNQKMKEKNIPSVALDL